MYAFRLSVLFCCHLFCAVGCFDSIFWFLLTIVEKKNTKNLYHYADVVQTITLYVDITLHRAFNIRFYSIRLVIDLTKDTPST